MLSSSGSNKRRQRQRPLAAIESASFIGATGASGDTVTATRIGTGAIHRGDLCGARGRRTSRCPGPTRRPGDHSRRSKISGAIQ